MFFKIKDVKVLDNFILLITFENDVRKYYDVKMLFSKNKGFKTLLTDEGLFQTVQVDIGGYGIYWNDEIDISCNELWNNGIQDKNI